MLLPTAGAYGRTTSGFPAVTKEFSVSEIPARGLLLKTAAVLGDYGSGYLVLLGAGGIAVALWLLPGGLWGLIRGRTELSLFPAGYHVRRPDVAQ